MFSSKPFRITLVVLLGIAGFWFMSRSSSPSAETVERFEAQQSFAPFREASSNVVEVERNVPTVVRGAPVSPATVNVVSLPSRPSEVDRTLEQYLAGKLDFELNEGPLSESAARNLVAESAEQAVDSTVQNYSASVLAASTLNAGTNFKSIDYTQSQQGVPPDPDITVGRDHIIVGVNTSFQIFDKQGNSLVGPTLFEDFWGSNCGTGSGVVMFDPYLDYDEKEGRYILGITAYDPAVNRGNNGFACIAVSQTDSANGSWNLYSFDGNPGGGKDYFFDYPHLGVGQDALYLSANMFGQFFQRNHVFAYDKFAMYAGQPASSVKVNVGSSYFTLQPAKVHGFDFGGWPSDPNEPHYFIDAQYGNSQSTLTVWGFSDPFGTASMNPVGTVTVNTYSLPIDQPQQGGSDLQGNDNRLLDVKYWGGKLYTTHAVGCNPGGGTVNCVRWYEIDVSSGSPSLVQQGTFASSGEYRSFPAIAPNACGDLLVGYTKMSNSTFPSIYVAGREAGDTLGQLKSETLLKAGEASYTAYDPAPHRWGDYTGMAIDPDGVTFWYVGEYSRSQATARWSTWVGSYSWGGCTPGGNPTPTPAPTDPPAPTPTPAPTSTPGATTSVSVGDLDASATNQGGRWTAIVEVTAVDNNGTPVSNASVDVSWSTGASGTCTTNSSGVCTVSESDIRKKTASVSMSVMNISHGSLSYDAGNNSDPDGDSNGTTIVVTKP